jgi:hypothetical protein
MEIIKLHFATNPTALELDGLGSMAPRHNAALGAINQGGRYLAIWPRP